MTQRADQFLQSFADLGGLLISEETITSTLRQIGELAVLGIDGCDSASVTFPDPGNVRSTAFTSVLAKAGDADQCATGEGPSITAIAERQTVRSDSMADEERWPQFRTRARERGIASMLSIPLVIDDSVGALNLYSRTKDGFCEQDRTLAALFAAQAAVAIANACVHERDVSLAAQLQGALTSRAVIDQAKGILMERRGCDSDEAFQMLVTASQQMNQKLKDLARELVESVPHSLLV